jgi:choline dehydrogenase-like flavoprotein
MLALLMTAVTAAGSGMDLYAGRCVGGSTVVNDALCWRPPAEILDGWRRDFGLAGWTEAALAPYVERAWREVNASPTGPAHRNRNARLLELGAERLGWAAESMPRSVRGCANLGLCNLGCPSNAKQSTLLTYLPRAERAGARVLDGVTVERVEVAAGSVAGVRGARAGAEVSVRAPLVVLAGGVLGTPPILQRSGVAAGDGLQVHSSVHVSAEFAEPVHAYYGPTMTWAVHELADVNGHAGPGVMIESVAGHPLVTAPTIGGFGPSHEAAMRRLAHFARALVVIRDRSRGRIDAEGAITYPVLAEDIERLRAGMMGAARAYLAAGALAVHLPVHGLAPVRSEGDLARVRDVSLAPSRLALLYAVHLFGGAAMGGERAGGVADERGAVRGVRGLWVADASGLPTNTGVNPQITIMANALRIATGIVTEARA